MPKNRNFEIPNYTQELAAKKPGEQLSVEGLACALYEGTPHLQNLAETLARQHSKAEALSFFDLMGPEIQNFWFGIAKQLIDHATEWERNEGSACRLSKREMERLKNLPKYGGVDAKQD